LVANSSERGFTITSRDIEHQEPVRLNERRDQDIFRPSAKHFPCADRKSQRSARPCCAACPGTDSAAGHALTRLLEPRLCNGIDSKTRPSPEQHWFDLGNNFCALVATVRVRPFLPLRLKSAPVGSNPRAANGQRTVWRPRQSSCGGRAELDSAAGTTKIGPTSTTWNERPGRIRWRKNDRPVKTSNSRHSICVDIRTAGNDLRAANQHRASSTAVRGVADVDLQTGRDLPP